MTESASETTTDINGVDPVADAENVVQLVPAEIVGVEGVADVAGVVEAVGAEAVAAEDAPTIEDQQLTLAIRHVLERQLVAGQDLSSEVVVAATDAAAAIVEAPAKVIGAVRAGATLPSAFGQTTDTVADIVAAAGSRIRTAVGDYVGGQAVLPNAVVTGATEVAGSLVRAQGELAGTAIDSALTVVTAAVRAEDVRDAIDREWRELSATATSARGDITDALADARDIVRAAVAGSDDD